MISPKDTLSAKDMKEAMSILNETAVRLSEDVDYFLVFPAWFRLHKKEIKAWVDRNYTKRGLKVRVVFSYPFESGFNKFIRKKKK